MNRTTRATNNEVCNRRNLSLWLLRVQAALAVCTGCTDAYTGDEADLVGWWLDGWTETMVVEELFGAE